MRVTFDIRRWRAREWVVLAAGMLLLAVSMSGWYVIGSRLGDGSAAIRLEARRRPRLGACSSW